MEYFSDLVGKKMKIGIVLYTGKNIINYQDNLFAMPIDILWA